MLQVEITKFGAPHVLQPREVPTPRPGPDQVLISVEAAGINFADVMARMGLYDSTPPLPAVMGWEVAGIVEEVGPGVDPGLSGAEVIALSHFGGYASHVVVDEIQVARRPASMSASVGAAIPVSGLSAWMMLEVMGRVREGDRVLVHSAGGALGLMCIGLLQWRGAYTVGTASSHKHQILRDAGYDRLIDYRREDVADVLEHDEGFDLILDPLGGESWSTSLDLLRGGGRMVVYGYSNAVTGESRSLRSMLDIVFDIPWLSFSPFSLMRRNVGVLGIEMEHMWDERRRVRGWLERLVELWEDGIVRPRIHAEVPLVDAARAHRMLHNRENIGKVVLTN